ncbi:alpha/beta hydrolase family protein [Spirosoma sp. KUDC1026]|uniref:alpha/beta hydrolase family protein n=1 Tax=Spirosoma sp. KUDC1026 TaxID=2745947 RepID=UPI00159BA09A|nr:alpha/beta fold hydrolase [Spirosoma sp. KUDC1026]QKZ13536.1 alpha/beta fold hydrolase [Spirosoma sp. KUDC1026]
MAAQMGPWRPRDLAKPPLYRWINAETEPVRQLIYSGPAYGNLASTDVFAYYAKPSNGATGKRPAIVLVHGGDGYAFKDWVQLWASRGYHAIAMDLGGSGPDYQRLSKGGPSQNSREKFTSIAQPQDRQWVYHAVSNVMAAHSLIRSLPDVDTSRTIMAGVSWGGFLTTIVAGLDPRLSAVSISYGCGFLNEPGSVFDQDFLSLTAQQRTQWLTKYDPSNYLPQVRTPVLWLAGATDQYFAPVSLSKSSSLVAQNSQYSLRPYFKHSQSDGANAPEIEVFFNQILFGAPPLATLTAEHVGSGLVSARVLAKTRVYGAALSYTTDNTLPYESRRWITLPAKVEGSSITAPALPTNTTIWFLTAVDERNTIVSGAYHVVQH